MATINENLQIIKNSTAAIKQAIINKGGTINGDITTWANSVTNIPSGGEKPVIDEKDVNFYDYDGTILYAYTKDEFLALSDLPPLPIQPGLICQGWNWDYEKAIDYVTIYKVLNIGATYITDDDKTRLYIDISSYNKKVSLFLLLDNTEITIDWGDGNTTTTNTDCNGNDNGTHIYEFCGKYCITITVNSGTLYLGNSGSLSCVLGGSIGYFMKNSRNEILYKVELGTNIKIGSYAFNNCTRLLTINFPKYINSGGEYAFEYCYSLKAIIFPKSYNNISEFIMCTSLKHVIFGDSSSYMLRGFRLCLLQSITLPKSLILTSTVVFELSNLINISLPQTITTIYSWQFLNCSDLSYLVIPSNVKTIDNQAFDGCTKMQFYNFSNHTSVPTLVSTNAFTNIPSDCKIIVPDNLYDTWKTATNWSTYASYIVKASEFPIND